MASGDQRLRADEPAGADPLRVVGRGDQQRRMHPPRVDAGVADLDPVVDAVDGLEHHAGVAERRHRDVGQPRGIGRFDLEDGTGFGGRFGLQQPEAGDRFAAVGRGFGGLAGLGVGALARRLARRALDGGGGRLVGLLVADRRVRAGRCLARLAGLGRGARRGGLGCLGLGGHSCSSIGVDRCRGLSGVAGCGRRRSAAGRWTL